jgi:antitoxin (DNA-binding transcriptional repressor) of toxin-antitoxin stability system
VERGEEVITTRRGKPVAKIVRIESTQRLTAAQKAARERMLARMRKGYRLGGQGEFALLRIIGETNRLT